jgi:ABC-type Fe3+/spermidine/putrescine transport system ATPase subunit
MGGFQNRPAPTLSGGQQQRVALARAIVTRPSLLLLDEPFSNLDAKLREQLRGEMRLLQRRLGIAVLFVTHDQIEALALSDRIAVMRAGVIQQEGRPSELYEQPATEFVRDFVGTTIMFTGRLTSGPSASSAHVKLDGEHTCVISGTVRASSASAIGEGRPVHVALRPEDVDVTVNDGRSRPATALAGRIVTALFVGERLEYQIDIAGQGRYVLHGPRRAPIATESEVWVIPRPDGHSIWDQ